MTETTTMLMMALEDFQKNYSEDVKNLSKLVENYSEKVEGLTVQVTILEQELADYIKQIESWSAHLLEKLEC